LCSVPGTRGRGATLRHSLCSFRSCSCSIPGTRGRGATLRHARPRILRGLALARRAPPSLAPARLRAAACVTRPARPTVPGVPCGSDPPSPGVPCWPGPPSPAWRAGRTHRRRRGVRARPTVAGVACRPGPPSPERR